MKIAHELGDLPLALHVAGTYLSYFAETVTPEAYLSDLKALFITEQLGQQAADIEDEETINPTNHTWHIGRTFRLSYDQILDKDTVAGAENRDSIKWIARRLLARTAVYAPGTAIPTELLFETFEITEPVEGVEAKGGKKDTPSVTPSRKSLQKGLNLLIRLGLIEQNQFDHEKGVMIHRLVADFVQTTGEQNDSDLIMAEQALLYRCNRISRAGYPRDLIPYHPHFYHLLDKVQERRDAPTANLMNEFGFNLRHLGDLAGAEFYYKQSLEICREVFGGKHPDTASALNNFGALLQAKADLTGAKRYFQQALDIHHKIFGRKHPDTANSLNNLGMLLSDLGDLAEAKKYLEQSLEINRDIFGDQHPYTATSLNNLGSLRSLMGDLAEAKSYYEQALEVCIEHFG